MMLDASYNDCSFSSAGTAPRAIARVLIGAAISLALAGCAESADTAPFASDVETVSSALTIGPAGHALTYFPCAAQGGTCSAPFGTHLAYGANGSFLFKEASFGDNTPCDATTFGGDPAPNGKKTCYFANYRSRCLENQNCNSDGRNIAYGANGSFNFKTINGNYVCNNATFGDPSPGAAKACYDALYGYGLVATEGGLMTGLNKSPIAYGAAGTFVFAIATGSVGCSNTAFGRDPAPGVVKACYKLYPPFAVDENFFFDGNERVFYFASGLNGNIVIKQLGNNVICRAADFGGDPHPGVAKHCYGPR
jgi:hypothetical protein